MRLDRGVVSVQGRAGGKHVLVLYVATVAAMAASHNARHYRRGASSPRRGSMAIPGGTASTFRFFIRSRFCWFSYVS